MDDEAVIPAPARLLRDFVNTYEPQVDQESLGSVRRLRDWVRTHQPLPGVRAWHATDLEQVRAVREGLRGVLLGHAGHDTDPASVEALNTILAREAVVIDFSPGGDYGLTPATGSPVGALIARLVGAVLRCREDGSWARLKVCDRESCRWAYYDG
ncbi:MAG TPA: ABATE domain-containing protein, partial [Microlunatus sp.]|nr:ABATE domain-containing protein [Microlunatus sp.]